MKIREFLIILFITLLPFLSCKEDNYFPPDKITLYQNTHIVVPDYYREKLGYDSIQLIIDYKGKVRANFCYPNSYIKYK